MAEALVLSDGRELAWAEFGRPDGVPVIALHGSPGTRCFLAPHGETARRLGVRLIAPDRPGYGLSTYDADRTYESGAGDVRQLADHLGLDRFGVLGVSSGGPNAAACARFHGDRTFACAIVSSPAPPEAAVPKDTIPRFNRIVRLGAAIAPRPTGFAFQVLLRRAQRVPDKAVATMARALPAWDAAVFQRPEIRDGARDELALPVAPTAGRAAVQDLKLELHAWGFRLEDLAVPVQVWHGERDHNVALASARYQAAAIPGAALQLVPDAGHLLVHRHFDDIVRRLVA